MISQMAEQLSAELKSFLADRYPYLLRGDVRQVNNILLRWRLITEYIGHNGLRFGHFLHIPKTGGTTLAHELERGAETQLISVDAPWDRFLGQLSHLKSDSSCSLITRAHHIFPQVINAGGASAARFVFSIYRKSSEVHVSNINMIHRRILRFKADPDGQPADVRAFSLHWLGLLEADGVEVRETKDTAIAIAASDAYVSQMGGIYGRYFSDCPLEEVNKVYFISTEETDDILTTVLGMDRPPARRNTAQSGALQVEDLRQSVIDRLVGDDERIETMIQDRLSSPEDLRRVWQKELLPISG